MHDLYQYLPSPISKLIILLQPEAPCGMCKRNETHTHTPPSHITLQCCDSRLSWGSQVGPTTIPTWEQPRAGAPGAGEA